MRPRLWTTDEEKEVARLAAISHITKILERPSLAGKKIDVERLVDRVSTTTGADCETILFAIDEVSQRDDVEIEGLDWITLRMAGHGGIALERQMDGAGNETVFVDGQWRAPA